MAQVKVAKRYARSFLGLVSEKGQLETAYTDMLLINSTTEENRDLVLMLKSPVVNTEKKISIMQSIYGGKLSEATMRFLTLIAKKRRESAIPEIAEEFISQYKILKGITTAVVASAVVLSDEAQKRIHRIVQTEIGGTIELTTEINPELIGGFVLRIGDRQLDTSILSKIDDLRQEFANRSYEKGV